MRRPSNLDLALIILASLLFAGSAYLFYSYADASEERSRLAQQVERKEPEAQRVIQLAEQADRLEIELGRMRAELARTAGVSFPADVLSIDVVDLALGAAIESGARILTFATDEATTETLGSQEYPASNFTLRVQIPVLHVAYFLRSLEEKGVATMTMDDITLGPASEEWELNMKMTILTQKQTGDAAE